jgi:outer membrane protein insertion porin family
VKKPCINFHILIFCLLFIPAQTEAQDELRGTQYEIDSIRVAGNRSISNTEILSKVRSRVGELFDPAIAAEDTKRIAQLSGVAYSYYNTTIVDNKIELTFVVVERNIVRSINFVGNREIKKKTLTEQLGLKKGDYLDPILAESGRRILAEFYRKKGFAFVQVELDSQQLPVGKVVYMIDEGVRVTIKSVKLAGNKSIKTSELKKALQTRKKRWLVWPRYYVEEEVAGDVAKLESIYYQRGFLDVSITAEREFSPDKRLIYLTFAIDEGPVYTVEKIVMTGNEHFTESQLREELKIEEGQVYNERTVDSDTKRLGKLYRENGFINAKVQHGRKFVSQRSVSVEFAITEGERFRIGRINITGNEETQDKVIRRVLDEYEFQPGQWYNADIAVGDGTGKLEESLKTIVLAESATVTPIGEAPGQKDAQVNIVEGRTGMVMLGAGISSDAGVIGQLAFEQRNFDIKDWPESLREFITGKAFKGAGQTLRIALQPGTEITQYSIEFTEPYFQNKPISLEVMGSRWRRYREAYDEGRLKEAVQFEKRYKNRWRRSIGFRAENVEVESVDFDAPKEIKSVEGDNTLFGVRMGVARDLTDSRFNPSTGIRFSGGYEQVGGDHTFGILSGTHRWYKTLYEDLAERKTVLGTKLHAATVVGDAPVFEKFYAGGMGSIRGFDYRGVSTRAGPDKDPSLAPPRRGGGSRAVPPLSAGHARADAAGDHCPAHRRLPSRHGRALFPGLGPTRI